MDLSVIIPIVSKCATQLLTMSNKFWYIYAINSIFYWTQSEESTQMTNHLTAIISSRTNANSQILITVIVANTFLQTVFDNILQALFPYLQASSCKMSYNSIVDFLH